MITLKLRCVESTTKRKANGFSMQDGTRRVRETHTGEFLTPRHETVRLYDLDAAPMPGREYTLTLAEADAPEAHGPPLDA